MIGACLLVSRRCCLPRPRWFRVLVSLFGSQLLQVPFTGSVVVLMKCGPLREQHGSVFSLRYLVVPTLRVYVLQPGVRGALQAKYWKAASPGPISGVFSVYRVFGRCAVVSLATRNVGLAALCGPRELDSVARKRTDFKLLCRTPLRSVSKSFIFGLAPEYVLRVHVRSVHLSEVEDRSYNHRATPITSCLLCTVCSKDIHVVWCCTEVFRPCVQFGTGICVCRSFAVFW